MTRTSTLAEGGILKRHVQSWEDELTADAVLVTRAA
jgi:hypothetical protein